MRRSDGRHARAAIALLAATVITGTLASVARAQPMDAPATTPWSVVTSPSPQHGADAQLRAVVCRTTTSCLVAGRRPRDDTPGYVIRPVVGDFRSSGWMPEYAPFPPKAFASGQLTALACATGTTCFAVGATSPDYNARTIIERWHGRWTAIPSPTPTNGGYARLDGIACPTKSRCFAVGGYINGSRAKTLIERWNGTSWSIGASPNPPRAKVQASLAAIACPGPNHCFAVGTATENNTSRTLVEAWNGSSWYIVPSPTPTATGRYELAAISCPAANNCLAVGRAIVAGKHTSLVLRWNGSAWSIVKSAIPGNAASRELNGVACVSTTNCFAVGSNGSNELIARWNGTGWTRFPTLTAGLLDAISCTGAARCVAVGSGRWALVAVWDGTSWALSATGGSTSRLGDVSCSSTTNCLAVGESAETLPQPLVERWDGSAWSSVAIPTLASGPLYYLLGTSCPASDACFVVGEQSVSDETAGNGLAPLALRWDGTSWTVLDIPPLPGVFGGLFGISCPSPTSCFAVGYTFGDSTTTLVEHWDGTAWSRMTSVDRTTTYNILWGISCVSASSCFAVGDSSVGSGITLVERWNGTAWSIVASPNAAGSGSSLRDVACASTTRCVATGDSNGGSKPLFESWDGTAWAVAPANAIPAGATFTGLEDLACETATNCVAVGTYRLASSRRSFVERWNGSKWLIEAVPEVGEQDGLYGVTCAVAGGCLAVGSYTNLGSDFTLVERSP